MEYELLRSKRKTVAIEIFPDGSVLVRAPKRMSRAEIDSFVDAKQQWIKKHRETALRRNEERQNEPLQDIDVDSLKKEAALFFPQRTEYFAEILGVSYGRISIRCQNTRWGSCSSKGNLNFNCLLMLMSGEIRDYVIVHELSHRRHMNHSAAFWKTVESVLPDYRQRRQELKTEGRKYLKAAVDDRQDAGRFFTYILRCSDNTLYTGYTNDLEKRLMAHNSGRGAKYTKVRRPVSLVYYEEYDSRQKAQRRETLIKQMTKREKERLIAGGGSF